MCRPKNVSTSSSHGSLEAQFEFIRAKQSLRNAAPRSPPERCFRDVASGSGQPAKSENLTPVKVETTSLELSVLKSKLEQSLRASQEMANNLSKMQPLGHLRTSRKGSTGCSIQPTDISYKEQQKAICMEAQLLLAISMRRKAWCSPGTLHNGMCHPDKQTDELEKTVNHQLLKQQQQLRLETSLPVAQSFSDDSSVHTPCLPLSDLLLLPCDGCTLVMPSIQHSDALAAWMPPPGLEDVAPSCRYPQFLTRQPHTEAGPKAHPIRISLSEATSASAVNEREGRTPNEEQARWRE